MYTLSKEDEDIVYNIEDSIENTRVKVQRMQEIIDELTSALGDAEEAISNLENDLCIANNTIESLEARLDGASLMLDES